MQYRFMRVLVFFDLPTVTSADLREYRRFRKFLIREGYLMLQESVYCKLALNHSVVDALRDRLARNKPRRGLVQILVVTERQFHKMDVLVGQVQSDVIDDDSRLVVL